MKKTEGKLCEEVFTESDTEMCTLQSSDRLYDFTYTGFRNLMEPQIIIYWSSIKRSVFPFTVTVRDNTWVV